MQQTRGLRTGTSCDSIARALPIDVSVCSDVFGLILSAPRVRRQRMSCPQKLQRVCLCLFAFILTSGTVEAGQEHIQLPVEGALESQVCCYC